MLKKWLSFRLRVTKISPESTITRVYSRANTMTQPESRDTRSNALRQRRRLADLGRQVGGDLDVGRDQVAHGVLLNEQ